MILGYTVVDPGFGLGAENFAEFFANVAKQSWASEMSKYQLGSALEALAFLAELF